MQGWAIGMIALVSLAVTDGASAAALVQAAPTEGRAASPRRLFNMGLAAEEKGDGLGAVARYMAARAVPRTSFADTLYARGAGLRLIRLLAGRDDDAAAAIATALAQDGGSRPGTDLSPLVRSLLAHVERDLEVLEGVLVAVRLDAEGGTELRVVDAEGVSRLIRAIAPVRPFTAGDAVRVLVRRGPEAVAQLVAMGPKADQAWRLLEVRSVPSLGKSPPLSERTRAPDPS